MTAHPNRAPSAERIMTVAAPAHPGAAPRRYRLVIRGGLLFLSALAFAASLALTYSLVPSHLSSSAQQMVVDLERTLALLAPICVGLLVLSWRLARSQQREVALRIAAEHRERELAHQDSATGLPNRRQFENELRAAIAAPPRSGGTHAVLMLDLRDFKRINDRYGHPTGDEVMALVARRLKKALRDGDFVARWGGDEFVILAHQLAGAEEATSVALQVMRVLEPRITIGGAKHRIGVAIGIALIPQDARDDGEIMRKVAIALHRAKAEPVSAFRFFAAEMDARIRERNLIESALAVAVKEGSVQPYYQPLIALATGKLVGFEALARWTHPTLGTVTPDRFIPVAESCGLIGALSDLLLRQAAAAACQWPDDLTLAFNISPLQTKDVTLPVRILSILTESGLAPRRLELELTESALVHDLRGAQEVLGALRRAGVRIALDDFGTGYSSLYHLRNFKIDTIKIDRSFIANVASEPEACALIRGLMGLGHGLGLKVTAEGIELPSQAKVLLAQGCDQAQGYLYGRPMPAADALQFIAAQQARETAAPAQARRA